MVRLTVSATVPSPIRMSLIIPRSTRSRCRSGSFTPFRALSTSCSVRLGLFLPNIAECPRFDRRRGVRVRVGSGPAGRRRVARKAPAGVSARPAGRSAGGRGSASSRARARAVPAALDQPRPRPGAEPGGASAAAAGDGRAGWPRRRSRASPPARGPAARPRRCASGSSTRTRASGAARIARSRSSSPARARRARSIRTSGQTTPATAAPGRPPNGFRPRGSASRRASAATAWPSRPSRSWITSTRLANGRAPLPARTRLAPEPSRDDASILTAAPVPARADAWHGRIAAPGFA